MGGGKLTIGQHFKATAQFRLICKGSITIGSNVLFGWDCTVMDTDWHKLTKVDGKGFTKGIAPVSIGDNCWFGTGCLVLKHTELPPYIVVSARSILNKKYDFEPNSVIGPNNDLELYAQGLYLDPQNNLL